MANTAHPNPFGDTLLLRMVPFALNMKYELETIPIWDAYELDTECPLCSLEEKAELGYVDFFLGNSVMIPEMRVEVNKTGFCPDHWKRLFDAEKNRHPLGLVGHTHLLDTMAKIRKARKGLNQAAESGKGQKAAEKYAEFLKERERECMICSRVDYTLKRYAFTIVYLWQKDDEFKEAFGKSRGFCMHHVPTILAMADEILNRKKHTEFISSLIALQDAAYDRLEGEILWFTQKFDFQNDGKPWGTSKDALHRTLQKLSGKIMHERK